MRFASVARGHAGVIYVFVSCSPVVSFSRFSCCFADGSRALCAGVNASLRASGASHLLSLPECTPSWVGGAVGCDPPWCSLLLLVESSRSVPLCLRGFPRLPPFGNAPFFGAFIVRGNCVFRGRLRSLRGTAVSIRVPFSGPAGVFVRSFFCACGGWFPRARRGV